MIRPPRGLDAEKALSQRTAQAELEELKVRVGGLERLVSSLPSMYRTESGIDDESESDDESENDDESDNEDTADKQEETILESIQEHEEEEEKMPLVDEEGFTTVARGKKNKGKTYKI